MNHQLRRAYDRANGVSRRIDNTQTRNHIEQLIARSWTQDQIAAAAGLNQATVSVILSGRFTGVRRSTAAAILAIRLDQTPPIPRGFTDATGTRRRLQALMVLGYTVPDVARRAGVSPSTLHEAAEGCWKMIQTPTAAKVARVYRLLSVRPAPRTRAGEQARNLAMARGWYGPMAWDDIDDPACEPDRCGPVAPGHVHAEDVAELAAQGLDDVRIAVRLNVSPRTVLRARTVHNIPAGVAS